MFTIAAALMMMSTVDHKPSAMSESETRVAIACGMAVVFDVLTEIYLFWRQIG